MAVLKKPITLEDFLELPERKPALEFVDGKVTQKVPPKARHSALQGMLCGLVNQLVFPDKQGLAFPETPAGARDDRSKIGRS